MPVNDVIQVMGRGTSVDFTIDDAAPFDMVTEVLAEYLQKNRTLYSKGNITVNLGRRILCPEEMSEIKRILDFGSDFHVSRFWCSPEVLEEALTRSAVESAESDAATDISREQIESEIEENSHNDETWDGPESARYTEMAFRAKVEAEKSSQPSQEVKTTRVKVESSSTVLDIQDSLNPETANLKAELERNPEFGRGVQALLVKSTCRSGEVIRYPGDVIVLADVNPGAKIIAGGDIIVLGNLRGLAYAGAPADRRAAIIALKLDAHRLQIGSYLGTVPKSRSRTRASRNNPQIAYVRRRSIYVEAYAGRLAGYNGGILYDG